MGLCWDAMGQLAGAMWRCVHCTLRPPMKMVRQQASGLSPCHTGLVIVGCQDKTPKTKHQRGLPSKVRRALAVAWMAHGCRRRGADRERRGGHIPSRSRARARAPHSASRRRSLASVAVLLSLGVCLKRRPALAFRRSFTALGTERKVNSAQCSHDWRRGERSVRKPAIKL